MADRRNPFEGVTDYFSEFGRLRSRGVHGDRSVQPGHHDHASAWVPTTDILADGSDLVIRMDLAGVDPDAVDLWFNQGTLTVSGILEVPSRHEQAQYYVRERPSGEFRRTIDLPPGVDASQINASFEDGLVEITVEGGASHGDDGTRISVTDRSASGPRRRKPRK